MIRGKVVLVPFPFDDLFFATTGLRVASTLRLHRLMTVSTLLIRRELGVLSPRLQALVSTKIRDLFSL